jgi:hypothetical protein
MPIQQTQGNSAAGKTPTPQAYGLKSPQEAIDILSLVTLVNSQGGRTNIVKDQKAFADPNMKAQAVVEFFKQAGLSPKELIALGAAIKRDLRNGTLKLDQASSRIEISSEALTGKYLPLARRMTNPNAEMTHTEKRKPLKAAEAKIPEIKMLALGNIGGPAPVDTESYTPAYQQLAGNLTILKMLVKDPQVQRLVDRALAENNLLKGASVNA